MGSSGSGVVWLVIIIVVVVSMLSRLMDTDRIRGHVEERGGKLLEKRWAPFGPGWYGDHKRIYAVRYSDRDGNEHQAHCKTHPFSGVYWTVDNIVGHAKPRVSATEVQEENARLRREIEHLKGRSPA